MVLSLYVCVCEYVCLPVYLFISLSKCSCFLDADGSPIGELDMRQRLIIALGAAKG